MRKRALLSIVLAFVLLFLCVCPANGAGLPGDVDSSGAVTAADARHALRIAVGMDIATALQRTLADVDGNGSVTAADARQILRIAVGLDSPLSAVLYSLAHGYYYKTFRDIHPTRSPLEAVLDSINDWCCYYTLHDVFIPVLKTLGYSETRIDQIAPTTYSSAKLAAALKNSANIPVVSAAAGTIIRWYVPSLLLDYYLEHPQYVTNYIFWDYYDDVIDLQVIRKTSNCAYYTPRVGDLVFMSNKTASYKKGYPTLDHTAQIIEVYPDGSFLCTEGSIIQNNETDGKARVRERQYAYEQDKGTYTFIYNPDVNILAIVRPNF